MMGSIFFLFGVVLILFSQNGTLTLQWQGQDGIYFLLFAIPLIIFGWKFLQQLETND
jgi:membrane protein implicated in regulation of membrane protease activity